MKEMEIKEIIELLETQKELQKQKIKRNKIDIRDL